MFVHDAEIPIPFALAVHAIRHNQATEDHWLTILNHEDTAERWIKMIYEANGMKWTPEESGWWVANLYCQASGQEPFTDEEMDAINEASTMRRYKHRGYHAYKNGDHLN